MTQHETLPSPTAAPGRGPARRPRLAWIAPALAVTGVALVAGVLMVPVDAVIQSPGPTWNVLGGVTAEGASVPLPSLTPDGTASPVPSSGTTPQPASLDASPQPGAGSPATQAASGQASPSGQPGLASPSSPSPQAGTLTDQGEAAASDTDTDTDTDAGPGQVRPLISVTGAPTYPASGALRMTTVSVRGCPGYPVTAWDLLRAWLSRDEVVVDRESVCPRSMSAEEVEEVNQAQMSGSEDSAVTAALAETGLATRQTLTVTGVARQQTAAVRAGDVITAVRLAGQTTQVDTYAGLRDLLRTIPAGTQITVEVLREGQEVSVPLTTLAPDGADAEESGTEGAGSEDTGTKDTGTDGAGSQDGAGSLLGVLLQVEADSPVKATFALQDVGGPSAGMMFALGIVDTLTPGDLTGGTDVAGTGTISPDGTVGPIGGIAQKMAGASHDGARYFLAPADNCAEVIGHEPPGMEVYSVSTLHEAVQATQAIASGTTADLAQCHR